MASYDNAAEARAWARQNLRGVTGCVMPSFTADMSGLNEAAIVHDIHRELELGFSGFLIVAECGTTAAEFDRFVEICVAESGDALTILQAAEPTVDANIELIKRSADAGVDLVMPSYPLGFYPQSGDEVVAYTKALADASHLGLIVFAMNLWNFERLHPSGFAVDWLRRLVDGVPNIVAIKNEVAEPGVAGISEVFRKFADDVVVADPLEMNSPAWTTSYGMPWMGTSNYEYFGAEVPRYFEMLQDPERYDEAMEIYWRIHPARQASGGLMKEANSGTVFVHRMLWKYQGWLQGFNGGPVRPPHTRLLDRQMRTLRAAAVASGLDVTDEPDTEFFRGRCGA
ncbi:dihydrodipicolinate synthase family protein [Nocardioides sp. LHD-245]|uniref:dihydrodipicolinate synthase family protein n=1 Tax=Nocardioides sp. LHD-245 TaxID=3051387 RepID=UPI0027E18504|nr:dihydrodipicolinate synthase family protein [Nocardioides sp. LHD-245]